MKELRQKNYSSDLFHKERAFAERSRLSWYILSAEHGLVFPEQWLAPYERYLPDESATYRKAWGAILAHRNGSDEVDEIALTSWMEQHLRVIAIPYEDADSLGRVEEAKLVELHPPLNLKGMADSSIRQRIKELRRAVVH